MADILSAVSVLLIFLTFLLNVLEKQISEKIQSKPPEKAQIQKYKSYKEDIVKLLLLKSFPLTLIFICTFYSLLPLSVQIISISSLNLWNFDELNTIFIFVEVGLFALMVISILKLFDLIKKISNLK